MTWASWIHRPDAPAYPPQTLPGTIQTPTTEPLLQGTEDPSPGSGMRTGLVLIVLLAGCSFWSVSMSSPGFSDWIVTPVLLVAAARIAIVVLALL